MTMEWWNGQSEWMVMTNTQDGWNWVNWVFQDYCPQGLYLIREEVTTGRKSRYELYIVPTMKPYESTRKRELDMEMERGHHGICFGKEEAYKGVIGCENTGRASDIRRLYKCNILAFYANT